MNATSNPVWDAYDKCLTCTHYYWDSIFNEYSCDLGFGAGFWHAENDYTQDAIFECINHEEEI